MSSPDNRFLRLRGQQLQAEADQAASVEERARAEALARDLAQQEQELTAAAVITEAPLESEAEDQWADQFDRLLGRVSEPERVEIRKFFTQVMLIKRIVHEERFRTYSAVQARSVDTKRLETLTNEALHEAISRAQPDQIRADSADYNFLLVLMRQRGLETIALALSKK